MSTEKRMCRNCGRDGTFASMHFQSGGVYGECFNVQACERRRIAGDRRSDRAESIIIKRETHWMGNGFGSETTHTAYQMGKVVGEWRRDMLAGNYAFDHRGAAVATYKDWRKWLEAGA